MNKYFECKIKYERLLENGKTKNVTDSYIVPALSFTEAEAAITREASHFLSNFFVQDIKRVSYSEIFHDDNEDSDTWFKCKVSFIAFDENSGKESKTSVWMLVQAANIDGAVDNLNKYMIGSVDYQIGSITETNIVDVY